MKPPEQAPVFPIRINRYLAIKKHSTRRGADDLIKKKQVMINGRLAVLGDKVKETDTVEVKFRGKPTTYIYRAYNKPRGVGTHDAQKSDAEAGGSKAAQKTPGGRELFPIGGLDKDAHGLIIMTNDGRVTDRLLGSAYPHEKEYYVVTKNPLRSSFKQKIEAGVKIENNEETAKCKVKILDDNAFRIILYDEVKHQVKRMCVALFQEVKDMQCTRIMNIQLGNLKEERERPIEGDELKVFLDSLNLG
jgi:23S rRNA pseudouridine2604 synthase